jgi:hypothetical protein
MKFSVNVLANSLTIHEYHNITLYIYIYKLVKTFAFTYPQHAKFLYIYIYNLIMVLNFSNERKFPPFAYP